MNLSELNLQMEIFIHWCIIYQIWSKSVKEFERYM